MSGRFSPSEVYTFLSVQAVVGTIAVAPRFWARRIKRATFWWDDWLALLTVILFWGFAGIAIEGPYDEIELHNKVKTLMVADLALTAVTVTTARLSIIFLYYRIFSVSTQMTLCLWAIDMASMGWMIGSLVILPLNCQPVHALFDPTVTGKCLNPQKQIMAAETINSVLDTILVVLPIPLIKKLHLPMREKVAISTIFLLGGL
ncbi:hypothetical protein BS50DRAFT_665737 [Corynespora cassiicola Philippines]|uniref:Rhodopsin domain-containing protein n=1 Tax=Corynespora cassiicola Philippines TaxID=1448308 RepID=A0A2T2NRU5_CORCC|nr:hypothetical protein BS50DRAFT_665737 [Corynespora cassiicola Philippines]